LAYMEFFCLAYLSTTAVCFAWLVGNCCYEQSVLCTHPLRFLVALGVTLSVELQRTRMHNFISVTITKLIKNIIIFSRLYSLIFFHKTFRDYSRICCYLYNFYHISSIFFQKQQSFEYKGQFFSNCTRA